MNTYKITKSGERRYRGRMADSDGLYVVRDADYAAYYVVCEETTHGPEAIGADDAYDIWRRLLSGQDITSAYRCVVLGSRLAG